jgi:transcriptional regulator with XRE-family HTH domain
VAQRAGISAFTYQKYEKGESRPGSPANPTLTVLVALSQALEVPVAKLLPSKLPDLTSGELRGRR